MASRVGGFFLGLLFLALAVFPFVTQFIGVDFVTTVGNLYYFHMLGPIPTVSLIFLLMGVFCLQSSIRDVWPFYG